MTAICGEAQRQAAFLRLLAEADGATSPPGFAESADRVAAGLRAYRRNARAAAGQALAAVFPTLRDMLGSDDFMRLATEFRRSCPPVHGDLGEWGEALGDFVADHPALQRWPWLADCARLDFALHRNERAADAPTDRGSLRLLNEVDPSGLRLVLMPGTAVLRSEWPIATLHRAHRPPADASTEGFDTARHAVASRHGESVVVVRQGWRATCVVLDASTAAFTAAVVDGATLAAALDRAGEGFDVGTWLARAVGECWLARIERVPEVLARDGEGVVE